MAITRVALPQQFKHSAVIAHGAHPQYRLEFPALVKDEAASRNIYQGSVVSINDDGEYILGCPAGSGVQYPVPCISLKNVMDPDVTTGIIETMTVISGGTPTVVDDLSKSTFNAIGGKITAIPCTGGYELESSEFDQSKTYKPGHALTVELSGGTAQTGRITLATEQPFQAAGASEVILGYVSRAPFSVKSLGQNRIAFFTSFIPVAHA